MMLPNFRDQSRLNIWQLQLRKPSDAVSHLQQLHGILCHTALAWQAQTN
jgi:hypothetical protein